MRNPNWDPDTDFRPAYLDSVEFQEGFEDTASASRKVLSGEASVNGDFTPPPNVLKDAATEPEEEGQLALTPSGGNRYIALNTTEAAVRRHQRPQGGARERRPDRAAQYVGGELVGPVATHFIPPEMPRLRGGRRRRGRSGHDFVADPEGDPELAADYMREGRLQERQVRGRLCGHDGRRERGAHKDTAEVVARPARGARASTSTCGSSASDVMYTRFCAVPDQRRTSAPTSAGSRTSTIRSRSSTSPSTARRSTPTNNSNFPPLDDKAVNDAIAEAPLVNDPEERSAGLGRARHPDHGAGAGDPLGLGQPGEHPVRRRRRA